MRRSYSPDKSYEEMVMRTEHEMRRVMEFLGHRFERTMLAHHTRISNITLAPNGSSYQYRGTNIRVTLFTCKIIRKWDTLMYAR